MVGNFSSDGVTIETLVGGNLKTYKPNKMKIKSQKTCCIGSCADKLGLPPQWGNRLGLKSMLLKKTPLMKNRLINFSKNRRN